MGSRVECLGFRIGVSFFFFSGLVVQGWGLAQGFGWGSSSVWGLGFRGLGFRGLPRRRFYMYMLVQRVDDGHTNLVLTVSPKISGGEVTLQRSSEFADGGP